MTTLMSAVSHDKPNKFNELIQNASSKHVDRALHRAVLTDRDQYFEPLLSHPNLTQKGFETFFKCLHFNKRKDLLLKYIKDVRCTPEFLVDQLLL